MFKEFQNSEPTCWLSVKQSMSVKSLGVYADTGKKKKIHTGRNSTQKGQTILVPSQHMVSTKKLLAKNHMHASATIAKNSIVENFYQPIKLIM